MILVVHVRSFYRIPKEIMHKIPTTLLHSLEGMRDLDWEKLLKLQSQDGSFLFSPSSTAFAFMQTRDSNCLRYLRNAVKRFNGGGLLASNHLSYYIYWSHIRITSTFCSLLIYFCLNYSFIFSVPNVFPVDLFEHIWIVDRLQRLGISRYFEEEIKECLDYVHRFKKRYIYVYVLTLFLYQTRVTLMMMMIKYQILDRQRHMLG